MLRKDYYVTLGISRTESPSGLRSAFRALVKRYHPERIGPRGAAFLREIVTAYHVLSNPEKRRLYDEGLLHAEGKGRAPEPPINVGAVPRPTALVPTAVRELHVTETLWPPTEAIISHMQRSFLRPEVSQGEPLQCLNVHIIVSPDEAARGGIATIPIPVFFFCGACGGSGRSRGLPCTICDGQGVAEEEDTIRLHIPPMVEELRCTEIPVRGLGLHNCYLRVYIRVAG
jgi:hypothetical protein